MSLIENHPFRDVPACLLLDMGHGVFEVSAVLTDHPLGSVGVCGVRVAIRRDADGLWRVDGSEAPLCLVDAVRAARAVSALTPVPHRNPYASGGTWD